MKRKSIISLLIFCMGLGMFTTSCEDMLSPDSERHSYTVAQDTLYSYWGILKSLQNVAERYIVLGECRGDLVGGTSNVSDTINAILNFGQNGYADKIKDGSCMYLKASDYYHIINSCNAYIAKCDTLRTTGTLQPYMTKELAQVESIRAWVYLQLVQVYGEVPFYLEPMLTTDDINKFINDPNHETVNAHNLADKFEDRLIKMAGIEKVYGFPQYASYGYTTTVAHSTKCMFPCNLVLGDLYLEKGDKASCAKAAQCYYDYITLVPPEATAVTPYCGPLTANYYSTVNVMEGEDKPVYSRSGTPFTEKDRVRNTYEAITCIPSSTNKLWGRVLSSINRLFGYDATIRVGTSGNAENATTTASISLGINMDRELIASKGYEALCDSQKYEIYIGTSTDPMAELVVMPEVGDARQSWVVEKTQRNGDETRYGRFITKQNPTTKTSDLETSGVSFTTTYPMIYRKATVWLRYAEALNRAGYPSYAFAILKNGLCNNDNWYPNPETDYAIKDTIFCYPYEYTDANDETVADTLRKDSRDALTDALAAMVEEGKLAAADVKDSKIFLEAASTYNYPADDATAICYYLDKREVSNLPTYMNYFTAQMKTNITNISIQYKADIFSRGVSSASYPSGTSTGENYLTSGIHSRGCGRIAYDERNSCYNYVDMVAMKVKENHNIDLTKNDIYSGAYDDYVQEAVEDLIIDEMGLELAFEGTRFFDLSRVALRRNDPSFLAKRVAKRNGNMDMTMYNILCNEKNWYLPFPEEQ